MEAVDKKRLRQDKKNLLRRQHRQEARAAIFINAYVETKHQEIYEEAVAFYNHVNNIHPEKSDLRKTEEFKALKQGMTFVAKQHGKPEKNPRQVYLPITTVNQQNFTVHTYEDLQTTEQATTEQYPEQATTEQHPEQATTEQSTNKHEKIMQLRIPLMSSTVTSQTLKIVTQEIVEENPLTTACNELQDMESTLDEEIPQEAFDAILAGLREDPNLTKLMEEIEIDTDLNNILEDIDVDLPIEDDRLERELNWEAW